MAITNDRNNAQTPWLYESAGTDQLLDSFRNTWLSQWSKAQEDEEYDKYLQEHYSVLYHNVGGSAHHMTMEHVFMQVQETKKDPNVDLEHDYPELYAADKYFTAVSESLHSKADVEDDLLDSIRSLENPQKTGHAEKEVSKSHTFTEMITPLAGCRLGLIGGAQIRAIQGPRFQNVTIPAKVYGDDKTNKRLAEATAKLGDIATGIEVKEPTDYNNYSFGQ